MIRILLGFCLALTLWNTPAQAAWHEASSEHFVIYADQSGKSVQAFAERLEKFHAAMAFVIGKEPETPSPSNRITVFVVDNRQKVRRLADIKKKYAAGIYLPRAGNIVAIVPRLRSGGNKFSLSPDTILRHEYAHHFQFNITSRAFPLWFQEGFAEFFASGQDHRDGTVVLGAPAVHRAYELALSREVPIEQLLNSANYLQNKSKRHDQFYGRSWLLYHYLSFEESRADQLAEFQILMAKGATDIAAARQAFGDLNTLERELDRYAERKKMMTFAITADRLRPSPVTMRKLGEGEAEMMPLIMQSRTGVDETEAAALLVKAREIAAQYPNDAAVLEALAEAEFDAGYDQEAIAAADRALALDGKRVRAQIQKIYAHARRAQSADDPATAWRKVRAQIVAANRIENDHPVPLMEYYRTYRSAGETPPDLAVAGLQRALQLAPFDQGLRLTVATQYMQDKDYQSAVTILGPLAYNPHRSPAAKAAEQLLQLAQTAQATGETEATAAAGVGANGTD